MTPSLVPILEVVCVLVPNAWVAARYARIPIGQDLGLWMLWGFTGSVPYRDHVDCKPPAIHLWGWVLARITRQSLAWSRALHHLALGGIAVVVLGVTGSLATALLFTGVVQSARLHAYHAWVEAISGALLALALVTASWWAAGLAAGAVLFNLKLAVPALLLLVLQGSWAPAATLISAGVVCLAACRVLWPSAVRDVWYGVVTVAARLTRLRRERGQGLLPRRDAYHLRPLTLVAPMLVLASIPEPDPRLWAVIGSYVLVNGLGRVWRPYHWIPVVACAAVAAPPLALVVVAVDWASDRFYLGNVLRRTRPATAELLEAARVVGETLRATPGTLYVADPNTQIYVYARRRPAVRLVEQVEIADVVPERRRGLTTARPPDILVRGPGSMHLAPRAYRIAFSRRGFVVATLLPQVEVTPT